jgi:transposase
MINNFLFGDNYPIYNIEESDDKLVLYLKSKVHECECPFCHEISNSYHSTYERFIQDTPIHCKQTWLNISTHKFDCLNEKCECKTFAEQLSFAKCSQVKTDTLISMILGISIFLSNSSASLILSLIGIKVSADTIKNIYDRIEIIDNPDIEEIGVDDVATRKGMKYATAIYDLKDHHLIALLEGRDSKTLEEWLKNHKKVKIVARDRASSYAKAINKILPDCVQVADRYHLFENLLEKLKDIFKEEIPDEIYVQNGHLLDTQPKKVKDLFVNEETLRQLNYDNSIPLGNDGKPINFDSKIREIDSKQYIKNKESRMKKKQLIINIQKRWNELEIKDYQIIVKEFKVCLSTAKKYVNISPEEIEMLNNVTVYKKRKKDLDDFDNIIYKMLKDNLEYKVIYSYIYYKGYTGKPTTLEHHIYSINKNNFSNNPPKTIKKVNMVYPEDVTIIKRTGLLKFILTINSKIKKDKLIEENIEILKERYPIIKDIEQVFIDFHSVIMSDEPDLIDQFLEIYENTKINSFCESIKKDIAPVKNAISYEISSGFVEGNNNKFKLIKRIVYGKSKLVNLFRKCYIAFLATKEDFSLFDLI